MATKEQLGQIAAMRALWRKNSGIRERAERMTRMARGDWASRIPRMPAESIDHQRAKPNFAPNILGWALRQLTYLYDRPPARTLEEEDQAAWAQPSLWDFAFGLDSALTASDFNARLYGASLLQLSYKFSADSASSIRAWLLGRDDATPSGPDGVETNAIARHLYEGMPNEMDPRYLEGCAVLIGKDDDGHELHHYWTETEYAYLIDWTPTPIGDGGEDIIKHGIGALPFILIRNTEHAHGLDATPTGGYDLEQNILSIGSLWREYGWTAKLQRGQPWVSGEIKNATLAPDAIMNVEQDSTFGISGNSANLQGMRDAVLDFMGGVAQSMGLPPRAFRVDVSSSVSGVSIALDRAELADDRLSREKIFKLAERDLHRRAAQVYASATGTDQQADLVGVQYRPRPTIISTDDAFKRVVFLRDHDLISDADTISELYPDKTPREVEAWLERAEADMARRIEEADRQAQLEAERQAEVAKAAVPPPPASPFAGLLE